MGVAGRTTYRGDQSLKRPYLPLNEMRGVLRDRLGAMGFDGARLSEVETGAIIGSSAGVGHAAYLRNRLYNQGVHAVRHSRSKDFKGMDIAKSQSLVYRANSRWLVDFSSTCSG